MGLVLHLVILLEPLRAGNETCTLTGQSLPALWGRGVGEREERKARPCLGLTSSPMGLCLLWAASPLPPVRAMDDENQQKL